MPEGTPGPAVDFEALFRRSPNPYMVLDRELRFVTAHEAYLRVTSSRIEELVTNAVTYGVEGPPVTVVMRGARRGSEAERPAEDGTTFTVRLPRVAPGGA